MTCGKRSWPTKGLAEAGLHSIWRSGHKGGPHKLPTRTYKCPQCGQFHLTSQPFKSR